MSIRRTPAALAAIVLAGVFSTVMLAGPANAVENCDFDGFEVDGDTPANCDPIIFDDWDTVGPDFVDSNGGTYSASSKDIQDPAGWTAAGNTPDKADIETIASFTRIGADGHTYLYLGWTRENNTGTGKYAIELTNAGANSVLTGDDVLTPQPIRSEGGVVAYVQFQGADLPVLEQICSYDDQASYPDSTNFDATNCNAVDEEDFASGIADDGLFFEVAFDLTAILGLEASCPPGDVTAYLRGVTGGADHGNLKAFAEPITAPGPSNCLPIIPDEPVLPATGSTETLTLGLGAGVLALAGLILLVGARRSRNA
jgi:LPXTG-motif cell wall-anchored protein